MSTHQCIWGKIDLLLFFAAHEEHNKTKDANAGGDTSAAKTPGYPARSFFKISAIDKKNPLFYPGGAVLDLGCFPGSWTLYAAEKVGQKGLVLGLDLSQATFKFPANVKVMGQDVFTWNEKESYLHHRFDVVLSDMAPATSGNHDLDHARSYDLCCRTLEIATAVLSPKPKSAVVMKFFQGEKFSEFQTELRKHFKQVKVVVPDAVRKGSKEVFLVGRGPLPVGGPSGGPLPYMDGPSKAADVPT